MTDLRKRALVTSGGIVAAILALALAAYANSFRAGFVFDDLYSVKENALIRELGNYLPGGSGYRALPNRYLAFASFALNYRLGGLDVFGYHAVNFGVHVVNALLVYALVVLAFRTPRIRGSALAASSRSVGFLAAALFATHPLQTEAVTYVCQRPTSLATLLYLAAVVQYLAFRLSQEGGRGAFATGARYALVLAAALLAMKTKEIAFTLPFMVVVVELALFGRPGRREILFLLPVLATGLVIPLTLVDVGKPVSGVLSDVSEATRVQYRISRLYYLATQFAVVATYLRLLVLPVGQNLDYDHPLYRSFLEPRVLSSAALLSGLGALSAVLYLWTRPSARRPVDPAYRLVALGITWFFLALSVESSVIPIADFIAERRVYLPSVGFFVAVATAGAYAWRAVLPARAATATAATAVLLGLVLAAATFHRNRLWIDPVDLWEDTASKSPGKARVHLSLGVAYYERGRVDDAISEYARAIALQPDYADAHTNIGIAYLKKGLREDARREMLLGVKLRAGAPR